MNKIEVKKKDIAKKMTKVMGFEVPEGSKRHSKLLNEKKHHEDLLKYES